MAPHARAMQPQAKAMAQPANEVAPEPRIRAQAKHCRAFGDGLTHGTLREPAYFIIEAAGDRGPGTERECCMEGGECFFVAIRGRGVRLRARVDDLHDGQYQVRFVPTVSGEYSIAVSLLGEMLPGSPFECTIATAAPYAPNCSVSGAALSQVIARSSHHFEVQFRDLHGYVAHADELDVYVERLEAGDDAERASTGNRADTDVRHGDDAGAAIQHKAAAPSTSSPVPPICTSECIITSSSPLVVRSGSSLDSARVGQLLPGRRVHVLDIQEDPTGQGTRARIALHEDEPVHHLERGESQYGDDAWRELFHERPEWWDEVTAKPHLNAMIQTGIRRVALGWVTVKKGDRAFIAPRKQLPAGERQLYKQAWLRRIAVDKSLAAGDGRKVDKDKDLIGRPKVKKLVALTTRQQHSIFKNELASDPTGIGFAFGGMEPGRLHAHGKPVETHKVYFSVGMCGKYLLHVGLRQGSQPLPNSPFELEVIPGPAHPLSTTLPLDKLPLRGVVGFDVGHGTKLVLQSRDKMGNACRKGGAKICCTCPDSCVNIGCEDHGDGSYSLSWNSGVCGTFDISITIDGANIVGSPTPLKLHSGAPDLGKTKIWGPGLSTFQAGTATSVFFQFKDVHGNVARPSTSYAFGMTLVRVIDKDIKDRWRTESSYEYQGSWNEDNFEMRYTPTTAGELHLYLWTFNKASKESKRSLMPNSPFKATCVAALAHAEGSFIDGFMKVEAVDKFGKKLAALRDAPDKTSANMVSAGEMILLNPQIRDQFGNPAAVAEGSLAIEVEPPDGTRLKLELNSYVRAGLTMYEARYEPRVKGDFIANVLLAGAPINGSPVPFHVDATLPDPAKSHYILPEQPWYSQTAYEVVLVASDKFGNSCTRGGAYISGRLQSATLPSGQDSNLQVTDNGDGTYILHMYMNAPCDIKLIITIANTDNSRGASGGGSTGSASSGELPPIPMAFLSLKQAKLLERRASMLAAATDLSETTDQEDPQAAPDAAAPTPLPVLQAPVPAPAHVAKEGRNSKSGGKSIVAPANEIISAFGAPEERRAKVIHAEQAVQMATEAFAKAGRERAATNHNR